MRRRGFALVGVVVTGVCGTALGDLPNGVSSGDVTTDSAVLWTRTDTPGELRLDYSTDPTFLANVWSARQTVSDPTLPVKLLADQLQAGTQYYFRATDAAGAVQTGSFQTPAAAGARQGLRFGVSGDWRGELAPFPAISNAPARSLDLFVKLGDTIYADYPSPAVPASQATTLAEYRAKHDEVYGSRLGLNAFADLQRHTPIFATIDDHEVTNDFQGFATVQPGAQEALYQAPAGTPINQTPLYNLGLQTFGEYNAIRDDVYADTGSDPRFDNRPKLYRSQRYGSDAQVIVTDARSFRDAGLPGVLNPTDPAQVGGFVVQSFTPGRTMLGGRQVADLKADLLQAQASGTTWKFVHVPEPIQNFGVVGASDRFEGYAAERTDLLKFIDDHAIDNVVFVAADIHGTVVNNLTYQLGPGGPQVATNAFEITTGAVAFDAPFGPTVIGLGQAAGLVSPQEAAFYASLPVANDADSLLNDRDDFVKALVNLQVGSLGYDPVGLNDNLPQADGLIDATLLQGDYLATHTYGWTEFDIDPLTQLLTVTTWGIDPYTEGNPGGVLPVVALPNFRTPRIVSQFTVAAVPEPAGASVVAIVGLLALRRRR